MDINVNVADATAAWDSRQGGLAARHAWKIYNVLMTSLWRQNDATSSFWRQRDVIVVSWVQLNMFGWWWWWCEDDGVVLVLLVMMMMKWSTSSLSSLSLCRPFEYVTDGDNGDEDDDVLLMSLLLSLLSSFIIIIISSSNGCWAVRYFGHAFAMQVSKWPISNINSLRPSDAYMRQ